MKTWLITGCSTGIGRGIARAVLKSGDRAIVTARNGLRFILRDGTEWRV